MRLYPSSFQRAYGEEALQLFRDRARDQKGFLSGLRLWLNLLGDLAISVPREYRSVSAAVAVSQAQHLCDGTPSFHILEAEALSFRSLFYGGIASLVVYAFILLLISHGGNPFPFSTPDFHQDIKFLIIGSVIAFIVAMLAIKTFITYLEKSGFKLFGYYRIIAGIIIIILYFTGNALHTM